MTFSQNIAIMIDNVFQELGYNRGYSIFDPAFTSFTK